MLTIRSIMTRDVKVLSPETSIRAAMDFLVANHLSGAPVLSGKAVLGVVSVTDLLGFAANLRNEFPTVGAPLEEPVEEDSRPEEFFDLASVPCFFSEAADDVTDEAAAMFASSEFAEWSVLDEHVVSEVMTRTTLALPSSASAREAAALMERHNIHRVLVIDDGRLVGIVTALDITRAVAAGRFNVRTYLFNRDRDFARRS